MTKTAAENFALSQCLTEWPEEMTYDEVLTALVEGHEDVIVWENFEDDLPSDVVETIEGMRVALLRSVADMTNDLRQAIHRGDPMDIAERLISLENQLGL